MPAPFKIALASDHAGITLRQAVAEHLRGLGHDVLDLGPQDRASIDYPDKAAEVAAALTEGRAERGVLVCGSGIGVSIAANRHAGIRAALCTNEYLARLSRQHNDANVLCLGERVLGVGVALAIVDAFFSTEFEGGRHARRVAKLDDRSQC
jgi:ribose 5-phosphate isomerase B